MLYSKSFFLHSRALPRGQSCAEIAYDRNESVVTGKDIAPFFIYLTCFVYPEVFLFFLHLEKTA